MKIPETVMVYGKEIPIKFKEMDDYGLTDGCTIWISTECPAKLIKQTLLHELVHCLFRRVSIVQADISSDIEEVIADTIAVVMDENFILRARNL